MNSALIESNYSVQLPLSSANEDLQPMLSGKRRVIALNKQDLANRNLMHV